MVKLFPCLFGSALKGEGITEMLNMLDSYTVQAAYPQDFGAKVYKISHDDQGNRLTHLKITGGALKPKDSLKYTKPDGEKAEEYVQKYDLQDKKIIVSSDAHNLTDMRDKQNYFDLDDEPYSSNFVRQQLFKILR